MSVQVFLLSLCFVDGLHARCVLKMEHPVVQSKKRNVLCNVCVWVGVMRYKESALSCTDEKE